MAENVVVKEQLTEAMIDAGAELTRALVDLQMPISAALWLFTVDDDWQLVFASPDVADKCPLAVHRQINVARDRLGQKVAAIPLLGVRVLEGDAALVRQLRTAVPADAGIRRIRFTKRVADGRYIEDALIYRVM